MTPTISVPHVLAVAASDSSGGAGIQADLKTFAARGVYGMSALTGVTAQDSTAIYALHLLPPEMVTGQIRAVLADMGADAIKTGLLLRTPVIEAVEAALQEASYRGPLVVDPVMVAGDGRPLLDEAAREAYRRHLFPRATLITPNLIEAALLTGRAVESAEHMAGAAQALLETGAEAVLVKGGHLPDGDMLDVLAMRDGQLYRFAAARLPVVNPRGTGCTFAACITAELAKGRDLRLAVETAQSYVGAAIAAAVGWHLGRGRGTVDHRVDIP